MLKRKGLQERKRFEEKHKHGEVALNFVLKQWFS